MTGETLAIILVGGLVALFVLLLVAALVRSRQAATRFRETAAGVRPRPEPEPAAAAPAKPKPVSRREFFRRSLLVSVSLFGAQFGVASLAFLWPNLRGGFGGLIDVGFSPADIKQQIDADRQPFYFGSGRFYIVPYSANPVPEIYQGFVAEGLMALYQKCVHLGCRVPFCEVSQWFECPCHGSKYNRAGEWTDGPAPRGMDRFPISVQNGRVVVDTSVAGQPISLGPPRGTETIEQPPEGPFCVTIGGE